MYLVLVLIIKYLPLDIDRIVFCNYPNLVLIKFPCSPPTKEDTGYGRYFCECAVIMVIML